jgi:hypothetical protein
MLISEKIKTLPNGRRAGEILKQKNAGCIARNVVFDGEIVEMKLLHHPPMLLLKFGVKRGDKIEVVD